MGTMHRLEFILTNKIMVKIMSNCLWYPKVGGLWVLNIIERKKTMALLQHGINRDLVVRTIIIKASNKRKKVLPFQWMMNFAVKMQIEIFRLAFGRTNGRQWANGNRMANIYALRLSIHHCFRLTAKRVHWKKRGAEQ